MAFYGGFTQEINKDPGSRTFNINYVDKKFSNPNNTNINACYNEYKSYVENGKGVNKVINYTLNMTYIDPDVSPTFSIDGGSQVEFKVTNKKAYSGAFSTMVIDSANAHDPFLESDYKGGKRQPLLKGATFSEGNSKGEVMVSSAFLSAYSLDESTIIGRKLSVNTYTMHFGIETSSSDTEQWHDDIGLRYARKVACFKDYTIVGVFNADIYSKGTFRKNVSIVEGMDDANKNNNVYFWISSDSIDPTGASYPTLKEATKTETFDGNETTQYYQWAYYPEHPLTLSKSVVNEGYAYFPLGLGVANNGKNNIHFAGTQMVEYSSFDLAKAAYNDILGYYGDSYDAAAIENPSVSGSIYAPATFVVYLQFYDIFLYVSLGLAVLGGVIFVATLLNLINTLHFSIKSMRGFLGICRAEGLRNNGVIRLFLNQILWIFFYAYIATTILGSGICVGIIFGFNSVVSGLFEEMSSIAVTLQWYFIPIALGILVVITTVISLLFSVLLAGKTSRTPVLEILSEETK